MFDARAVARAVHVDGPARVLGFGLRDALAGRLAVRDPGALLERREARGLRLHRGVDGLHRLRDLGERARQIRRRLRLRGDRWCRRRSLRLRRESLGEALDLGQHLLDGRDEAGDAGFPAAAPRFRRCRARSPPPRRSRRPRRGCSRAIDASWLPSSGESLRISTAWVRLSSAASATLRGVSSSSGASSSGAPRAGAPSASFSAFFGGFFPAGFPEGSSSDAGAPSGSSSCSSSSSSSSSSGSFFRREGFGGLAVLLLFFLFLLGRNLGGRRLLRLLGLGVGLLGRLLRLRRRLLARPASRRRANGAGLRRSRLLGLLLRHLRLPLHDEKPPLVGGAIDQRDFLDEHVEQAMNAPLG